MEMSVTKNTVGDNFAIGAKYMGLAPDVDKFYKEDEEDQRDNWTKICERVEFPNTVTTFDGLLTDVTGKSPYLVGTAKKLETGLGRPQPNKQKVQHAVKNRH